MNPSFPKYIMKNHIVSLGCRHLDCRTYNYVLYSEAWERLDDGDMTPHYADLKSKRLGLTWVSPQEVYDNS